MTTRSNAIDLLVTMIQSQKIGDLDGWNHAYVTAGGTYIIASQGKWNDSGKPRDLVAVLPSSSKALGLGCCVVQLNPAVNTDFIDALREALDG